MVGTIRDSPQGILDIQPSPDATSSASALVGPFATSSDRLSVTGAGGPDLAVNTTLVVLYQILGKSGSDQTLWSYADGSGGWRIDIGSDGHAKIVLTGEASHQLYLRDGADEGINAIAISRTGTTALRCSLNGLSVQAKTIGTYTTAGSSAQNVIGGVNTATVGSGQPATAIQVLAVAHVPIAASDAQLMAWAGIPNATERYLLSSGILSTATSAWQAIDWNGSSSTTTAGHGSSPTTWTRGGSVSRASIEAENVYLCQQSWYWDAPFSLTQTTEAGAAYTQTPEYIEPQFTYALRSCFARVVFATAAAPSRMAFGVVNDAAYAPSPVDDTALGLLSGALIQGGGGTQYYPNMGIIVREQGLRVRDAAQSFSGSAALQSATEWQIVNGLHNYYTASSPRRGVQSYSIRIPLSAAPLTVRLPRTVRHRILGLGDSIMNGFSGDPPQLNGWFVKIRARLSASAGATQEGHGGMPWTELCNFTDPGINAKAAALVPYLDGSDTNMLIINLGVNDYFRSLWSAAGASVPIGKYLDDVHAFRPSTTMVLIGPTHLTVESANGFGDTLQDWVNMLSTVASTRPYLQFIDGFTLMDQANVSSDGVHPNPTGYAQIDTNLTAVLGPWP